MAITGHWPANHLAPSNAQRSKGLPGLYTTLCLKIYSPAKLPPPLWVGYRSCLNNSLHHIIAVVLLLLRRHYVILHRRLHVSCQQRSCGFAVDRGVSNVVTRYCSPALKIACNQCHKASASYAAGRVVTVLPAVMSLLICAPPPKVYIRGWVRFCVEEREGSFSTVQQHSCENCTKWRVARKAQKTNRSWSPIAGHTLKMAHIYFANFPLHFHAWGSKSPRFCLDFRPFSHLNRRRLKRSNMSENCNELVKHRLDYVLPNS